MKINTEYLVYDIETVGSDPRDEGQLLCISWKHSSGDSGVARGDEIPERVFGWLASPSCALVSHTKYDPRWLRLEGYDVVGPIHDTKRMAHILNENTQLDLDYLAMHYCNIKMDKRITRSNNKVWFTDDDGNKMLMEEAWAAVPEQVKHYCQRDVDATYVLYETLYQRLTDQLWLRYWQEEEVPFTEVLLDMECRGLPIDLDAAASLRVELNDKAVHAVSELVNQLGYEINFGSPPQLRQVLFSRVWLQEERIPMDKESLAYGRRHIKGEVGYEQEPVWLPDNAELKAAGTKYATVLHYRKGLGLKVTPLTEKTKEPSTSSGDLIVHHGTHPFIQLLLQWRKINKVIGTYLDSYPRFSYGGRLYGTFDSAGTVTGRLSSSRPNLENQPSRGELGTAIRSLFKGRLIVGDHSQLEPRLMGHFSGDPVLLDIYRNNKDIYLTIANYIFGREVGKEDDERGIAKTLVLALGYGAGPPKVAQILFINGYPTSVDRAEEYMAHLESLFATFFSWKRHIDAEARERGYIKTIGGRFRRLRWSYGDAAWKVRNKASRQAVNSIIQGSAADILRRNMLACRRFEPAVSLLNQVHDELVWEYDPDRVYSSMLQEIQDVCQNPGYDLSIPLKFEPVYCDTWADKGTGIDLFTEDDGE